MTNFIKNYNIDPTNQPTKKTRSRTISSQSQQLIISNGAESDTIIKQNYIQIFGNPTAKFELLISLIDESLKTFEIEIIEPE